MSLGDADRATTTGEGRRPLVLVVEDDVRAARALVRMLREDGFDAELCPDGAAAIGRLTRAPAPDALVTDLRMPHADGVAVARYGQLRRPGLLVFVVTSYDEQAARLDLDPKPSVFPKPLDYDLLSTSLRRELAARALPAA
jgi:CheY-like chemotaxis protein